jgi:hypothetical protein
MRAIDTSFKLIAGSIALGIEGAAVVLVAYGAVEAIVGCILVHSPADIAGRAKGSLAAFSACGCYWGWSSSRRLTLLGPLSHHMAGVGSIDSDRSNPNFSELVPSTGLEGREIRKNSYEAGTTPAWGGHECGSLNTSSLKARPATETIIVHPVRRITQSLLFHARLPTLCRCFAFRLQRFTVFRPFNIWLQERL